MGNLNFNSNASLHHIRTYDPTQWISLGKSNHVQIVRNSKNGVIAEVYNVPIDPKIPFIQNIQRYRYRQQANHNFVSVYQVLKEQNQYLCQGQQQLKIITERIPMRLSQINNLSLKEAFYIFFECLVGFRQILKLQGAININDQMIGFNAEGKIRVWLNQNFASNYPNENIQIMFKNFGQHKYGQLSSELKMLNQLYYAIQIHLQNKRFPQRFHMMFRNQNPVNFQTAPNVINAFVQTQRIQIINKININQYLNKPQKSIEQVHVPPPINQRVQIVPRLSVNNVRQRSVSIPNQRFVSNSKNKTLIEVARPTRKQIVSSLSFKTEFKHPHQNQNSLTPRKYLPPFKNSRQNVHRNTINIPNTIIKQNFIVENNNPVQAVKQITYQNRNQQLKIQRPHNIEPTPVTNTIAQINLKNAKINNIEQYQQSYQRNEPTVRKYNNVNIKNAQEKIQTHKQIYQFQEYNPLKNPLFLNLTDDSNKQTESQVRTVPLDSIASPSYQDLRIKLIEGMNQFNNINFNNEHTFRNRE